MLSYVPVIGRLRFSDYLRLFLAVTILIFEPILRFVFAIFTPLRYIVDWLRRFLVPKQFEAKLEQPHAPGEAHDKAEKILEGLNSTEEFARFWCVRELCTADVASCYLCGWKA